MLLTLTTHRATLLRVARVCAVSMSLVLLLPLASAQAEPVDDASRGTARDLAYEGVQAYHAEKYAEASALLERAYAVLKAPSLALWSARALEKSGRWVEAAERYLEATRLPDDTGGEVEVQRQAKIDATADHEALLLRLPHVEVVVRGVPQDRATVTIAGQRVPAALLGSKRAANPGTIEIVGTVGKTVVRRTVELEAAATARVILEFPPSALADREPPQEAGAETTEPKQADAGAKSSGRWQRGAGWIAIGLGGAAVVLGGVTAGLAADRQGQLDCPENICPSDTDPALVNDYNTFRTVSSVGFIAGGVLVAGGVTLLLVAPKSSTSASVSPYLTFASAGVRGRF